MSFVYTLSRFSNTLSSKSAVIWDVYVFVSKLVVNVGFQLLHKSIIFLLFVIYICGLNMSCKINEFNYKKKMLYNFFKCFGIFMILEYC